MRAVDLVVLAFALLAFDLVHNHGRWLGVVNGIWREVQTTLYG
jgi:hypothetical protein